MSYCWACAHPCDLDATCAGCGAPPWPDNTAAGGVYILQASNGLVKIGHSRVSIADRTDAIIRRAARRDVTVTVVETLLGASVQVERWLHTKFCETRDLAAASAAGLEAPSEWFWPTPALRRLIDGEEFIPADDDERWREVAE